MDQFLTEGEFNRITKYIKEMDNQIYYGAQGDTSLDVEESRQVCRRKIGKYLVARGWTRLN